MVSLKDVQDSNACIRNVLPEDIVAVFVGGTSGIGEYTLKELVRNVHRPRIYNIGRSQEASDRIAVECSSLNANVDYHFLQADVSLICRVDAVCAEIQAKEKFINLLFLSAGTLIRGEKTAEGLHLSASLKHYSRARFISNLLALIKAASGIRRVVSVLCGTKEGTINLDDIQGWNDGPTDLFKQRGHSSSLVTLIHAHFAQQAPSVSFIHDFPGNVKSNIARGTSGLVSGILGLFKLLGPLFYIPERESGERHLFMATSARFRAADGTEQSVPLPSHVTVARGIDGIEGSGVYSIDQNNESASPVVEELLANYKKEGYTDIVWGRYKAEYDRITNPGKK